MRKSLLKVTAAAMLAFAASPASADGDGPPAALYGPADWSGFYIGGHAGYLGADVDWNNSPPGGVLINPTPDGFAGGGLAGFNFQMDNIVVGIEGDFTFTDAKESLRNFGAGGLQATDVKSAATVRGRLGYAFDNILLFGTAGIGFVRLDLTDTGTAPSQDDQVHSGLVIGGGLESRLGNLLGMGEGLIGRIEYLYGDYGSEDYAIGALTDPADLETHTLRAALIWQFPVGL